MVGFCRRLLFFFFSVTVFQIGCVIEIHFDNIAVCFFFNKRDDHSVMCKADN